MHFSEASCGLIELFKFIFFKPPKEKVTRKSNQQIKVLKSDKTNKFDKLKELLLLFLVPVIDSSVNLVLSFQFSDEFNMFNEYVSLTTFLRISQIIFLGTLSSLILHIPIYRFHIVCFFSVFLLLSIILILEPINRNNFIGYGSYFLFIGVYLVCYFVNSIQYVMHRYIMDKYLYSPYSIRCISGLTGFVLDIIIMGFATIGKFNGLDFSSASQGWNNLFDNTYYIFCFIGAYINGIFVNIFIILINLYLTPSYNGIGDTLNGIFLTIIMCCFREFTVSFFIIIILTFALFICMVYSEIIVLNCCEFSTDTKNEIEKRSIHESKAIEMLIEKTILEEEKGENEENEENEILNEIQ